tara:strand:+ start:525 stop:767 length:243 start_codon:yes stop_codon:yes gene_type:complete
VNLQLDHFPMIKPQNNNPTRLPARPNGRTVRHNNPTKQTSCRSRLFGAPSPRTCLGARLSQRVAMDDLASYFVEERSKVR